MAWLKRVMERGQPPVAAPYATTPNGAPFPLRSWVPDAAIDIQNLAEWVDTNAVSIFANVAARDAAHGPPANSALEGRVCYLKDTGTLQMHNGYAWVGDTAWTLWTGINGWTSGTYARIDHTGMVTVHLDASGSARTSGIFASVPSNHSPDKVVQSAGWIYESAVIKFARLNISSVDVGVNAGYAAIGSVANIGGHFTYRGKFKSVR